MQPADGTAVGESDGVIGNGPFVVGSGDVAGGIWRFHVTSGEFAMIAGTLTISIDGASVQSADLSAITAYSNYAQQSIDISSYADGAAHTVLFQDDHPGGASDGNIFIDDVIVDSTGVRVPAR